VRIKLGIKAWATLSAMLLSVAVISGCNEEASTTPAPGGAGAGAGAGKAPDAGKSVTPPPPSPPKTDAEKKG
jgi:hypothetical protein